MSAVSVVIPVRDGERYLGEAIESVLEQTLPPAEVLVVDDGSTDSSAGVAEGYEPVRLVSQEPLGASAAINRGIAETGGDLVAMLDADDLWAPQKLERQVALLEAEPALEAVFGHVRSFISPDLEPSQRARLAAAPDPGPMRTRGTMLIRRSTLERVGPFDPAWRVGEFVDWHARAEDAGMRSVMLEEVVLQRRLHASNSGRSRDSDPMDYARVVRAALARRRVGS